jgi:hypothetical protein
MKNYIAIVWIWTALKCTCVKGLVLTMALLGGGGTFRRGPNGRSLGHWGIPLMGIVGAWSLPSFIYLFIDQLIASQP